MSTPYSTNDKDLWAGLRALFPELPERITRACITLEHNDLVHISVDFYPAKPAEEDTAQPE